MLEIKISSFSTVSVAALTA